MLFQEDSQKELLERNLRREGPIFEGDESLLWSNSIDNAMNINFPSLSKMINYRIMLKGKNHLNKSISSYIQLQNEYAQTFINSTQNDLNSGDKAYLIDPNIKSNLYPEYYFLLISMNGTHGLASHNQKHYFNFITNNFEPIYYDGMFDFSKELEKKDSEVYSAIFTKDSVYKTVKNKMEKNLLIKLKKIFNLT